MVLIPLSGNLGSGLFATVDECYADYLSQFKWWVLEKGVHNITYYAIGKTPHLSYPTRMHRLIYAMNQGVDIKDLSSKLSIDHINHDGLDNRLENLRATNQKGNLGNQRISERPKTSVFKGVFFNKERGKWQAQLSYSLNGVEKCKLLGRFATEIEAAIAYNKAALEYFGEFAYLNQIPS